MLTWFIKRRLAAFEKRFGYDASYMRELADIDLRAFMKFARAANLSSYRRDVPPEARLGAALAAVIAEDCGPCTQLCVTMALAEGIAPRTIAALVRGDESAMPDAAHLGYRFARATLAHDPAADELRDEIVARWGKRALVSLAFAITASRLYPTLKYALGHGKACQRIVVAGEPVVPPQRRVAAA